MIAAFTRRVGKAGLSGLLLVGLVSAACAESLVIELTSADAARDERTNEPIVQYRLSRQSQKAFSEITSKNVGRKSEMRIDGLVVVSGVMREPILGGSGQFSGGYTEQQTKDIAERLSAGRTRIEVEIVD